MDRGLKVLHVTSSIAPHFGGVSEAIRQYCASAKRLGHSFDVATLEPPGEPHFPNFPATVFPLGPALGNYRFAPRALSWLRRHVSEYDIIVAHGIWQFASVCTRLACRRARVPYAVFVHGMLDPWFRRQYPMKHLKKWMTWPWGDYRVLRDAAAALFTAGEEATLAARSFWLYRANPEITPLGVKAPPSDAAGQRRAFEERFRELAGRRFLLFISRIDRKKALDVLIASFARVAARDPEIVLAIGGYDHGAGRPALQRLARQLGVAERIVWLGEVPADAEWKWGAFRSAEAFTLASHMENFGIVVAEALSVGTPVLISDKINIWRDIAHDGAGLVGEDTVDGFAPVLQRWLSLPQSEKREMGIRALATFNRRYEADAACATLVNALSKYRTRSPSS
jgi:glycosyltransferase involved in cell wall biosynthesis